MFKLLFVIFSLFAKAHSKFDVCITCDELKENYKRVVTYGNNSCGATMNIKNPPIINNSTECSGQQTFENANQWCNNEMGMRLCTEEEVENNVPAGTGCRYDLERIWTSTSCGYNKYLTLPGHNQHWTLGGFEPPIISKVCSSSSEKHYVRCCSDYTNTCKSCANLIDKELTYNVRFGETSCGATPFIRVSDKEEDDICSGELSFTDASEYCNNYNMRLCGRDELKHNIAHGTGCGYDVERVWSKTECDANSHYTLPGYTLFGIINDIDEECTSDDQLNYVRCCADYNCCSSPKYVECTQHSDCTAGMFCGVECWTGNCGNAGTISKNTVAPVNYGYCQPCRECNIANNSITEDCNLCKDPTCLEYTDCDTCTNNNCGWQNNECSTGRVIHTEYMMYMDQLTNNTMYLNIFTGEKTNYKPATEPLIIKCVLNGEEVQHYLDYGWVDGCILNSLDCPTAAPTKIPTTSPVTIPTSAPVTSSPMSGPTSAPVTKSPITSPTNAPITGSPITIPTNIPTDSPVTIPTHKPTPHQGNLLKPLSLPTQTPTPKPTEEESNTLRNIIIGLASIPAVVVIGMAVSYLAEYLHNTNEEDIENDTGYDGDDENDSDDL